ncbi:rhomboid family intramembrane serine protease [Echinicola sp. CAU 1574]|uniref:Rhomboid family intramembrane serine protease n=1 Tax=Echinicola arenosa TaxID=2774144 RepID=A0ABR9AHY2_9BACT|nr:rhomboid family intramembrane serine protease [Echinicola arenosa]MBD8488393.1 rhomboid family intramembrane serine protease [Echinicola arenosa]
MDISATVLIIIITAISSFYGWKNYGFLSRSMFNPYLINSNKEFDRFILSGFVHKDAVHLLFNMITFYFFGSLVEQYLTYRFGFFPGVAIFILFYLGALAISDIPTYLKHKSNPNYQALGASGGTAAAVFASIILMPMQDICLFGILCLPGFILGIIFLGYSAIKSKQDNDSINHDAHLYGALFGIIFILILSPGSAVHFFDQVKNYSLF